MAWKPYLEQLKKYISKDELDFYFTQRNLDLLDQLLNKKHYKLILLDKDLFICYYNLIFIMKKDVDYYFCTHAINSMLNIFRIIIEGNINKENKQCSFILFYPYVSKANLYIEEFFEKQSGLYMINTTKLCHPATYNQIELILKKCFQNLGLNPKIQKKEERPITFNYIFENNSKQVQKTNTIEEYKEIITLDLSNLNEFYQIIPLIIKTKPNYPSLYPLFLKQEYCDFTLIDKEGISIQFHSILLYIHSDVFKAFFLNIMKESNTKTIHLKNIYLDVIKLMFDYLYMGFEFIKQKIIKEKVETGKIETAYLFNLFVLAHQFQIEELVDSCTNLLSMFCTEEDRGTIEEYSKIYNENIKLKELLDYFVKEK